MIDQLEFFEKIRKGDLQAFESLYRNYYKMLCIVADSYMNDKDVSEEIVGDVMFKIWERRHELFITTSMKAYLIRSVRNRCINYLEHIRYENKQKEIYSSGNGLQWATDYPLGDIFGEELNGEIQKAISLLPEQCRIIFLLSRDEELSYEEIAKKLNLSINTVKTQMKIALNKLRERLRDFL